MTPPYARCQGLAAPLKMHIVFIVIAHISSRWLARGVVLLKTLLLRLREVLCVFDLTDRDALVVALMVDGLDS